MNEKGFHPRNEREEFRPAVAFGRSLPAAVFWSLLMVAILPLAISSVPPFSFAQTFVHSPFGTVAIVVFGVITPLWSGLALAYSLRSRGHDGIRPSFLVLNLAFILGWIGLLLKIVLVVRNRDF